MYSSRKRRNKEIQKRHAKSLKLADSVAERKVMAQPEISHAFAEQILRSREPSTDGHLVDAINASHQPALFAGTLDGFHLQTVLGGQRWRFAEPPEVSA